MKLNTEKKIIILFLSIGCITYFLEYFENIKDYINDVVDDREYNYPQNEQNINSPYPIQEQRKVAKFRNSTNVMNYLFSNTFSDGEITIKISMGGISANGTGIGFCPKVIDFDDYEAILKYNSFTGATTTLYVNSINGTLTTSLGERFYVE